MRRSTISSGTPLLACFIILAKLINAANGANEMNENAEKNTPDGGVSIPDKRPLYAKDGFLAGEETPVWFAKVNREGKIKYRRVPSDTTPIVLRSVNYWKSLKNGVGFPIRKTRSVDDSRIFTSPGEFDMPSDTRNSSFYSPRLIEERSTIDSDVVYPSVLVVMDYNEVFSKADKNMASFVESLVLYALAFWGTVDSSLRNIQNPRVSLRIAGIIITKKRAASPYVQSNDGPELFVNALTPMMNYWRSVSNTNRDIPIGSYDIVAHMTDKYPSSLYTDWEAVIRENKPIRAAAVEGPPCKLPDNIAALIVYDNFGFDGLHRTIASMSKVLGGSEDSPKLYGWPRRIWTKETVEPISNALKNASCMSAPKEHHRPGIPIAPILAGELWPTEKQCESADYEPDARSCWETSDANARSNCYFLSCLNQRASGATCSRVGLLTLDGTFCNADNSKICLDGACVDKS